MSAGLIAGVDKIWLSTRDFQVRDGSLLGSTIKTKQGQKEADLPVILRDEQGKCFKGQQLEYRGQGKIDFYLGINQKGLSLQFNPSKVYHPYNLMNDVNDLSTINKQISDELNEVGIRLNTLDCNLSRLDLAKQDFMKRDLITYYPVFEFLDGKRMRGQSYQTGYTFMNGRHESCFYDKGEELKLQSIKGLFRAENRWKDTTLIRRSLGYSNFKDFLSSDCYEWTEHYNKYLDDKIFRKPKQGFIFDFDDQLSRLKYYKEKGRNAINNFLVETSLDSLLIYFGSINVLWTLMQEAGFSRQQIHNEKVRITEIIKSKSRGKSINVAILINEIRDKFAA